MHRSEVTVRDREARGRRETHLGDIRGSWKKRGLGSPNEVMRRPSTREATRSRERVPGEPPLLVSW